MRRILEKKERRLGERLFLKGERCYSQKCADARRPYPPGVHGKTKRRGSSEFGIGLKEKQKILFSYGVNERQLKNYFKKALRDKKHPTGDSFINMLERRLDNAVFRAGFATSRSVARHMVSYGHVKVNGKTVNQPSYAVRKGEVLGLSPKISGGSVLTGEIALRLKKYETPEWLKLNKEDKTAEVLKQPYETKLNINPNIKLVIEYYSK